MPERPSDEVLARHLLKGGFATDSQVKEALREQAERALKGAPVPLPQVLVKPGMIPAARRAAGARPPRPRPPGSRPRRSGRPYFFSPAL